MILVQMLLPRFLVLEVLLSLHLLQGSIACLRDVVRKKERNQDSVSAHSPSPNPNCSIDLDLAAPKYLPLFLSRATGEFILPSPKGADRDVKRDHP